MLAEQFDEITAYQRGLSDVVQERQSLSAILAIMDCRDTQIAYVRGWLSGERLLTGRNPLGEENE